MRFCEKCGYKLVDEQTKHCPKCKESFPYEAHKEKIPIRNKRKKLVITGVLFCIIILAVIGMMNEGSTVSTCEYEKQCVAGDISITSSNVRDAYGEVSMNFEFVNNTNMSYPITSGDFILIDNNDIAYSGQIRFWNGSLSFDEVVSNTKKKFTVHFELSSYEDIKEIRFQNRERNTLTIRFDGQGVKKANQIKQDEINKEKQDKLDAEQAKEEAEQAKRDMEKLSRAREDILKKVNLTLASPLPDLSEYDDAVILVVDYYSGKTVRKELLDRLQQKRENGERVITSEAINLISTTNIEINNEVYAEFCENNPDITKPYSGEVISMLKSCNLDNSHLDELQQLQDSGEKYGCDGKLE